MRLFKLLLFIFFSSALAAQDMQFYHFYSNSLYLNPAFAGAYEHPEIFAAYRNQWPSSVNNSYTYSFGYNHSLKKQWGGFGFYCLNESISKGTYTNISMHLSYSPSVLLKNYVLKPAFEGAYGSNSVDWDKVRFPDTLFPIAIRPLTVRNYFEYSAGILIYDSVFNAGVAVHHINQPDIGFFVWDEQPIPTKLTFHVNRNITLDKRGNFLLSPYAIVLIQSDATNYSFNLCFKAYALTAGVGYQGNDDYSYMIGLSGNRFRVSYTCDITRSSLRNATAASHEFFASFILNGKKPRNDKMYISRVAF